MKHIILILFLLGTHLLFAQQRKNNQFILGEKYTYLLHYGFINAGNAVVNLDKTLYKVNNRVCYRVDITAKSSGVLSMTYKINNLWRSYIDTAAFIPQKFYRNLQENSYRREETVFFDHTRKIVKQVHKTNDDPQETKEYTVPQGVQDMISGYYFIRTLDFDKLQKGDTLFFKGYLDGKVYEFNIKYLGKEKIKTAFGKIWTALLDPIMPDTKLFSGKDALKIWVSDDKNRVPVKIRAKIFIGAIELDLQKHEGLQEDFKQ